MTFAKASVLVAGFVGAMALGVWIGPSITSHTHPATDTASVQAPVQVPNESKPQPQRHAINVPKATPRTAAIPRAPVVDMSSPEFHEVIRPVLNRGADISIASSGFKDAEQFATVAHVAHDTEVPFMVLKHRVLEQKMSLASAIRESKPQVDAAAAVNRARTEARRDLAIFAG